eukprot:4449565-Ditylum_brightwellii.AAC.1
MSSHNSDKIPVISPPRDTRSRDELRYAQNSNQSAIAQTKQDAVWKKHGYERRQNLLHKYVFSQERTVHIDMKCPIEGYYAIAER